MTITTRNEHLAYMHTLAQLGLSMNGETTDKLYEACGDSVVFSNTMIRLAEQFENEWRQLTPEEHDEVGDDYIEEVEKLAAWIEDHIDDVVNNELEYSGYQAGRLEWAVVSEVVDASNGKTLCSDRAVIDVSSEEEAWGKLYGMVLASLRDYMDDRFRPRDAFYLRKDAFYLEMRKLETNTAQSDVVTVIKRWRLDKRRVPLKEST